MIAVGKHINGITINGLEYLLDDYGEVMTFDTEHDAREYLARQGMSDDDMYWLVFVKV